METVRLIVSDYRCPWTLGGKEQGRVSKLRVTRPEALSQAELKIVMVTYC